MKIIPQKGRVLIAEIKDEKVTESGIVLTGKGNSDTKRGEVLAIGSDVDQVSVGDTVFVDWTKGTIVKVEDAFRMIIKEEDILGVLEK